MSRARLATPLLILTAALGALGCPDLTPPVPDDLPDPNDGRNRAPVLAPIGTEVFNEGDLVRLVLVAYDPDNDPMFFEAGPLPRGATFDGVNGIFEWTPRLGDSAGSPYDIVFAATDGELESRSFGTLVIEPAPLAIRDVFPERIAQVGGERLTLTGVGFGEGATVRIAGVAARDVEVIDAQTIRATAPPLLNDFGPQVLTLSFPDGRSTILSNAVFVFRDERDLRLATHTVVPPAGARLLGAADLDGLRGASLLVGSDTGVTALDPSGLEPPRPITDEPALAAVGVDFDGDRTDAIVITGADGRVSVWLDDASTRIDVHDDAPAAALTTLDFDGDGDLDLYVVDANGDGWLYPWLTVDGGRFGQVIPSVATPAPEGSSAQTLVPRRLSPLDIDGDAVIDVLYDTDDGVGVARGVETGAFLPVQLIPRSEGLLAATPQHFEGFGWQVAAIDIDAELVRYYWTDEVGAWRVGQELGFDPRDGELDLTDVDGDGELDLVTSMTGLPGLRVDRRVGGRLDDATWLMLGRVEGQTLLADLTGDRIADLAIASSSDGGVAPIRWAERRRSDALPSAPLGLFSDRGLGLRVADYTRDGFVDVVVTGTALADVPVHLLFQLDVPGIRGSASIALPAPGDPDVVVLGDVTGDRWTDILSIDDEGLVTCTAALSASTFGAAQATQFARPAVELAGVSRPTGPMYVAVRFDDGGVLLATSDERCHLSLVERLDISAAQIDTGDLDGDRRFEVYAQTTDGALEVWSSPLGARFSREARLELGQTSPRRLATGDVDGDGRGDVVLADDAGVEVISQVLFARPGDVTVTVLDSGATDSVASGDLNGDGRSEVVATGGGVPPRVIWVDDDAVIVDVLPDWHSEARTPFLSDVDRDNDLDIVTLQPRFGAVIWPNGAAP